MEPDQITVALIENHWEQLKAGPPQVKFDTITSAELDDGEYELTYLVNGVLVRGQPGVIAGPKKTLKTNISVDLALSLAEADPFLGRFDVPIASRVGIIVGHTRWKAAKQLNLPEVPVHIATDLEPEAVKAYRIADTGQAD